MRILTSPSPSSHSQVKSKPQIQKSVTIYSKKNMIKIPISPPSPLPMMENIF